MAKRAQDKALIDRMRGSGLRKKVARSTSRAVAAAPGGKKARGKRAQNEVKSVVEDLRRLASVLEDRAKGGPGRRKAAARKAARTRKRRAAARSASAKKAARARARGKKR